MGNRGYVTYSTPASACANSENYNCKFGGTSAAAPLVAGSLALVLSRRHDLVGNSALQRSVLYNSAERSDTLQWDEFYGHGRVNAYRALLSVIRGDVNNDGVYDVYDVIMLVDIAFSGGQATLDNRTADLNCDGFADVFDIIYLVDIVDNGHPLPPPCFSYLSY